MNENSTLEGVFDGFHLSPSNNRTLKVNFKRFYISNIWSQQKNEGDAGWRRIFVCMLQTPLNKAVYIHSPQSPTDGQERNSDRQTDRPSDRYSKF